ncbi:MAG: hypothetical protein J6X48_05005 [Lachnospiraceae bacterium]|nr:hypothetical protein [Lachnospiraceae bacterium]
MGKRKQILSIIAAFFTATVFSLRLELYQGIDENKLLTIFNKLYNSFTSNALLEIVAVIGLFFFYDKWLKEEKGFDLFTAIVAAIMSFSFILATFYSKYNASDYMWGNIFQIGMTVVTLLGFSLFLYALLRMILLRESKALPGEKESFFKNHIFIVSAVVIFVFWMIWVIGNYPGSINPDSILQLQYFRGEEPWSNWHPPLSSILMGTCFTLGNKIKDANFGFFLYCLLQTITGSLIFAYALKKLKDFGVSLKALVLTLIYFSIVPIFGCYAQWFEKDFLYTQVVVLFLTFMLSIYTKKTCERKDLIGLTASALLCVFLRNNGIYAVIPSLIALLIWIKKDEKKRVSVALITTFASFILIVKILFPLIGVSATSVSESLGVMFQQTARYAVEYPGEIDDYEKQVLDANFQGMEHLYNYDPRINDPVKIYYNHSDFKGYLKVWLHQFFKHPGVYFESFFNGTYGYLAPVENDIGAWVQREYFDYQIELGAYHPTDNMVNKSLVWAWNLSQKLPILRFLTMPGLYTWITIVCAWYVLKRKQASKLILMIPTFINILVCMASPLALAMRYALPTLAGSVILLLFVFGINEEKEAFIN